MTADSVVSLAGAVPAFFAGLLPEGRRLTALRHGAKTSADDELSLLLALPVEDGCQVLGLHPAEKYRVSCEDLFARLSSLCEAPLPAAAEYLTQIAFAYVTGNGDAHAKNFSVLRDPDGRWQPTPAYDVPSSYFYGDHTMALSIDGRRDGNAPAPVSSPSGKLSVCPCERYAAPWTASPPRPTPGWTRSMRFLSTGGG